MPAVITSWPNLIASRSAYLKGVMVDEIKKRKPLYPSLFHVSDMSEYMERYESIAGFGLNQKIESEIPDDWPTDDLIQQYYKEFTQVWWGNGTVMSKKFLKYDKDGLKGYMRGRGLTRSAINTQEFVAFTVFNNLTSTGTDFVCPDGKALAATDHPLIDNLVGNADTYSNYAAATLDHAAIASLLTTLKGTPDQRGLPGMYTPAKLWCHPSLEHDAREILRSSMRSDTAENTTNVLTEYGLEIVPCYWITSTTNWGIQATDHELHFKIGQGIEVEVTRDFRNKAIYADVDQMFTFGVIDWRGMYIGNI